MCLNLSIDDRFARHIFGKEASGLAEAFFVFFENFCCINIGNLF
jgi:hypothetical protein